jgi:hypothetical protein
MCQPTALKKFLPLFWLASPLICFSKNRDQWLSDAGDLSVFAV